MADYCSATDVQNRLTANGYKFAADRDGSGSVSASEQSSYIQTAIDYAGGIIDGMIVKFIEPSNARSQGVQWLKDRAVDIASYRAATHGGRKAPKTLRDDYDSAFDMLRSIRDDGQKIPGLTVPMPANGGEWASIPVFINP